jgi:hypothetical protein
MNENKGRRLLWLEVGWSLFFSDNAGYLPTLPARETVNQWWTQREISYCTVWL